MLDKDHAPSNSQVEKFDYLSPMLDSALAEMREFSKRKQDGIVGATKIKILNRLLSDLREIVSDEATLDYLDPLEEEDLPQNSDAVLILGQYRSALNTFRGTHFNHDLGGLKWVTKEAIEDREHYLKEIYDEDGDEDEED